jgi:hypothetical protein
MSQRPSRFVPAHLRTYDLGLTDDDMRELEHGVPRIEWDEMDETLHEKWKAGQHFAIFAPTEGGKSHLIRRGLLPLWKRYPVMWIRFKQRDDSTAGFGTKVDRYPVIERAKYKVRGRDSEAWEDDPEWFLVQLGEYRFDANAPQDRSPSWHHARRVCGEAMDRAFREGGWVLVIDEVLAINGKNPPARDLGSQLENCLQRGRTQPLTMILATQQPAWNNPSMYDQARWVALGRPLDEARYERMGELGGSRKAVEAILPTLKGAQQAGGPEFLIVDRWTGDMWVSTAPPQ